MGKDMPPIFCGRITAILNQTVDHLLIGLAARGMEHNPGVKEDKKYQTINLIKG
jgi:hypothetical protein